MIQMKLFYATGPLEFVEIDILGEKFAIKSENRFLLVITDRFTNHTRTMPLKRITATAVAHAFLHHFVFVYGTAKMVISDNGSQFTVRFFTELCLIIGTKKKYTKTYHPQCNGKVDMFSRTILSASRNSLIYHPLQWYIFTNALTYAYNTQMHRTTKMEPLELVLSRRTPYLSLEYKPDFK